MNLTKQYFKFADVVMPSFAARRVYHVMSNPRLWKLKDFEEEVLNRAVQSTIKFNNFDIQVYKWGQPSSKICFLVHGWEGHAGNFGALVDILLSKGYHVISYDAPSHGRSSRGNTNMFEFADLAGFMFDKYRPDAVISHSYGSVSTAYSLYHNPELSLKKWVMVTTPHNFKERIRHVIDYLGASERTARRLMKMVEQDTGLSIDALNMTEYGANLRNVQQALIVHSKTDRVLPIESARKTNAAMPQSELIELDGLGHYAILWSEKLKEIITKNL